MRRDVKKLYNLPDEVKFCKTCTISNQRPRITFDDEGVCSACNFALFKKHEIDWEKRLEELEQLCDKHRKNNGDFDVIVPCSGGKDGSYVAHQLKEEFGMTPLGVTWSPIKASTVGRKNLDAFIASGFNHVIGNPDGQMYRRLTHLAFKHLGDPFQPFIYGQTNYPLHMAVKYNVPLIVYGENGEVEYGGNMKNAYRPTREIEDHDEHYFSGKPPSFWTEHGLATADLKPFMQPSIKEIKRNKTEIHFFSYYKYWDPQENFYYAKEHTGFTPNEERSEGTFTKYASLDDEIDGFHFYLSYIKFGQGRTTTDTAHEIRDKKITREEGIALVKRYDGEFPTKYYKEFLEYTSFTDEEVHEIVDSWRAEHIWKKVDNKWRLRKPIWKAFNKD
jgi:N-acetyl sugar amidotransferase|tara:strand:+ start:265 stop:1431 length:1167 start_codon:yes stop_codon:yes gene_type:complete